MPGSRSTAYVKRYSEEQFEAAKADVSSGSLSIRKSAQKHSVPFSTLQRHFQGSPRAKLSYEASARAMQKIAPEQEDHIEKWVIAQESLGIQVKQEDIRQFADKVLEVMVREAGGDVKKEKVTVGKHWGPKFMQRHPQIKAVRAALRNKLKSELRARQASSTAATASDASAATNNTSTVVNTPSVVNGHANSNGHGNGNGHVNGHVNGNGYSNGNGNGNGNSNGNGYPATPSGPRQRSNGGTRRQPARQRQLQHQQQVVEDNVDPELTEYQQDQDETVVMEDGEEDEEEEQGEEQDEEEEEEEKYDDDDDDVTSDSDGEEYGDEEQTPDQQLLMDSQRYTGGARS